MFYNVENLFDTIDSPIDDNEFLPGALRRWNSYRYFSKLTNISKVIVACNGWELPPVIGLCEVENIEVVNDLAQHTLLSKYKYKAVYADSHDERGIGVAMLIDTSKFNIDYISVAHPVDDSEEFITTRAILIVRLINEIDSLSVLVSHWPSRRGGAASTESLRKKVAQLINDLVDGIQIRNGAGEKIVIMGDFNSEPDSDVILKDLQAVNPVQGKVKEDCLYNLSVSSYNKGVGSYKYQGLWSIFDQVVVSGSLLLSDRGYGVRTNGFTIFQSEAILIPDTRYNGFKPFSTFSGPVYSGGYSDHLPVLVKLTY